MSSLDNFRERFEALEQQMEHLKHYTHTVERRLRGWRAMAGIIAGLALVSLPLPWGTAQDTLAERVAALEAKLVHVTSVTTAGLDEVMITGANLRIVNGMDNTATANGVGNLIVGYNELRRGDPDCAQIATDIGGSDSRFTCDDRRTGSHNVVVGRGHNFTHFGGLVVGLYNEIGADWASVSGGDANTASGIRSSVSGGFNSRAEGERASISGGNANDACGEDSSISGGNANMTECPQPLLGAPLLGQYSSVSGGGSNRASGIRSSVSGGNGVVQTVDDGWAAGSVGTVMSGQFRSP